MPDRFSNKNLLIISLGFPCGEVQSSSFVKSQVDELKRYFNRIYVISPTPYFPRFLGKFKVFPTLFQDFSRVNNYSYDNVEVFFPRYLTLPLEFFRQRNGAFARRATMSLIKKRKIFFDLIHAHFIWPSGYVAVELKKHYGVKVFITGHGFDVYSLPNKNDFWREKTLSVIGEADRIITVSKSNALHLKRIGYKGDVKIVPNGFDPKIFFPTDRFEARKMLGLPRDRKVILAVGNLIKIKNHKTLIDAVYELNREGEYVVLYLIGRGDHDESLKKQIEMLKAKGFVKLLGEKIHAELPHWMNAADVFALPSISESFGIVTIEALACGTPVVSTRNGGSEEIIVSEDFGFLQEDPSDSNTMKGLIKKALNKQWNKEKMVLYAQTYTWEKVCQEVMAEYIKFDN